MTTINNIFKALPDALTEEQFETLAETSQLKIERIVSRGQPSPTTGWHDQSQNEWVMVVQGEATLNFIDQPSISLGTGDFILIPAHQKHRVSYANPEKQTIWLAIHYPG
ncbi:MAG: cupin domain-containing protein [Immundisolibacteraceae bacterium]|nr:cupin domain-containing protein [Immundisolibacteraceae bacterium]